ncbi:MAG TPA: triple tyrosine motif-containing protein, partial [Parafilimonas sp.]|nr:triple tyrosine motif-containing protein [Parafilimonas sp.]
QAFYETSNHLIWVASRSDNSVSVFDENFNLIKRIIIQTNAVKKITPVYFICSFCEDNHHNLWMATATNELICYNLSSNKISVLKVSLVNYVPYSMVKDSSGNIWIGCNTTLVKLNPLTKNSTYFSAKNIYEIRDMCINKHDAIWIGTLQGGLYLFDTKKEKFTERFKLNQSKQSLSNKDIISMSECGDNILLLGTGEGMNIFNEHTKTFSLLKSADGNLSNVIEGINSDKNENIFAATYHGLYRIDAGTHNFAHYSLDDGVSEDLLYTKIYKLRDGRMLVGGVNSFSYFNPEDLKENFTPPDVRITGFKIFDTQYEPDTLLDKKNIIHLNYKDNFITIQYASLVYSSPSKIRYYYKLDDLDKNWVNASRRRNAVYTNLSNGNYVFEVKCMNDDGVFCKNITRLYIRIATPYYKSWWFILLCAVALIYLIYFLYRTRINQLKENEQEQINTMVATQEEERKRISRDLHDDVGTKLSALKLFISSFKSNVQKNQFSEATLLAENAETLINETMKDVREMLLNLSPSVLEEFGYATAVETLINKINSANMIYFKLVLFGFDRRLPREYELALYRITQELINNVLKHAAAKNVSLQIGYRDKRIILMIEDDGKGFDVSAHKNGYGLKNLDARTKLLHGTLHLDSMPGKGTSILIEIPFQI